VNVVKIHGIGGILLARYVAEEDDNQNGTGRGEMAKDVLIELWGGST
jgi:hypothetical protein